MPQPLQLEGNLDPAAQDFASRTADIPESFGTSEETPDGTGEAVETGAEPAGGLTVEAIESTLYQLSAMAAKMVKGGEFWQLQNQEARSLAEVWHPILAPLWAKWLSETNGYLLPALMVTTMSLVPRLSQEAARRASMKASTETENSGGLQPSSDLPAAANPLKPTD